MHNMKPSVFLSNKNLQQMEWSTTNQTSIKRMLHCCNFCCSQQQRAQSYVCYFATVLFKTRCPLLFSLSPEVWTREDSPPPAAASTCCSSRSPNLFGSRRVTPPSALRDVKINEVWWFFFSFFWTQSFFLAAGCFSPRWKLICVCADAGGRTGAMWLDDFLIGESYLEVALLTSTFHSSLGLLLPATIV